MWEPFGSCLLHSIANPAHFHLNWAGLAVLFSRQILNGSQDFFFSFIHIKFFIHFSKYETIETYAREFFMVINFSIGRVICECSLTFLRKKINFRQSIAWYVLIGLAFMHAGCVKSALNVRVVRKISLHGPIHEKNSHFTGEFRRELL